MIKELCAWIVKKSGVMDRGEDIKDLERGLMKVSGMLRSLSVHYVVKEGVPRNLTLEEAMVTQKAEIVAKDKAIQELREDVKDLDHRLRIADPIIFAAISQGPGSGGYNGTLRNLMARVRSIEIQLKGPQELSPAAKEARKATRNPK